MTTRPFLAALLAALLLTACSPLPPLPSRPQTLHRLALDVPTVPWPALPRRPRVLLLAHVDAVPALRSPDLLYRRGGPVVHRYAFHRWLATPAELLDQVLLERLIPHLPYRSVVRPEQGLGADRQLGLTLLRLEQDFADDRHSVLWLTVRAELVDLAGDRLVAARTFDYRVPAPEASPLGAAEAAGQAVARLLQALPAWLAEADPAGAAPR